MEEFINKLSEHEKNVIKLALQATVEGDFFEDWEFRTLIGVDRNTVQKVFNDWPKQTVDDDDFLCAVNGSIVNLIIYPHGMDDELEDRIEGGRLTLSKLIDKLINPGYYAPLVGGWEK